VTRPTVFQPAGWRMVTSKPCRQTVGATLDGLISRLEKTSDTPGLDAQVLLARFLDKPRSWLLAHLEESLTGNLLVELEKLATRLVGGEPLPYLLGTWEFFGLEFNVTPDVLIPRPETELLVERAIAWIRKSGFLKRAASVLDVGTGSGCIAVALAVNVSEITITATDISSAALKVARRNAEKMEVTRRITFLESDLFLNPAIPDLFYLIVANPPYIPTKTLHKIPVFGREPTLALDGGSYGLDLIRRILEKAPDRLVAGGLLLMEIEASEGSAVLSLATSVFPRARIYLHKDLAGKDRLLEIQT